MGDNYLDNLVGQRLIECMSLNFCLSGPWKDIKKREDGRREGLSHALLTSSLTHSLMRWGVSEAE